MLRSVKSLEGNTLGATDGTIGKLKDFYFDDEAWVIRYAVVDTSTWLGGRKVLVSPYAIREPSTVVGTLPVSVTREQIRNSPSIDTDKPISRQYEKTYLGYYDYPYYWGGFGLWGDYNYPGTLSDGLIESRYRGYLHSPSAEDSGSDPHLRSCNAVKGYHILASDGEIGHVQGFVLDDHSLVDRARSARLAGMDPGRELVRVEGHGGSQPSVDQGRTGVRRGRATGPGRGIGALSTLRARRLLAERSGSSIVGVPSMANHARGLSVRQFRSNVSAFVYLGFYGPSAHWNSPGLLKRSAKISVANLPSTTCPFSMSQKICNSGRSTTVIPSCSPITPPPTPIRSAGS